MSNEVDAIAASELATAAMLAALFERLAFKGLQRKCGATPTILLVFHVQHFH